MIQQKEHITVYQVANNTPECATHRESKEEFGDNNRRIVACGQKRRYRVWHVLLYDTAKTGCNVP